MLILMKETLLFVYDTVIYHISVGQNIVGLIENSEITQHFSDFPFLFLVWECSRYALCQCHIGV